MVDAQPVHHFCLVQLSIPYWNVSLKNHELALTEGTSPFNWNQVKFLGVEMVLSRTSDRWIVAVGIESSHEAAQ